MSVKDDREMKEIMKEAIKEWLDEQFARFGKWALGSFLAMAFIAVVKMAFAWWYLTGKP